MDTNFHRADTEQVGAMEVAWASFIESPAGKGCATRPGALTAFCAGFTMNAKVAAERERKLREVLARLVRRLELSGPLTRGDVEALDAARPLLKKE